MKEGEERRKRKRDKEAYIKYSFFQKNQFFRRIFCNFLDFKRDMIKI